MMSARLTLDKLTPWLLITPCVGGLLVFTYGPTIASFLLSFHEWDLLGTPHFVGLANYEALLKDPLFWTVASNTAWFVGVISILEVGLALLLALGLSHLLDKGFQRLSHALQAIYFLPFVTPMIAVALVFGWLYDSHQGLLNQALLGLGLVQEPVAWLYKTETALGSVAGLEVWKATGYNLVLFLAGLQTIPAQIKEAANIDGATGLQQIWRITLPMLTPTLFLVSLVTLIHALQSFDAIYLLTQGGPQHSSSVLVYWVYKNAFEFYRIGPASALAYLLFGILLTLTLVQWSLRKRWVLNES